MVLWIKHLEHGGSDSHVHEMVEGIHPMFTIQNKYITVQQIVNVIILPFSFVEKDFATKKISYPRICLEFRFYHFYFPKFCMSFIHSYVYLYLFSKCLAYYCLYLKISAHNYSRLILSKCGCFLTLHPFYY